MTALLLVPLPPTAHAASGLAAGGATPNARPSPSMNADKQALLRAHGRGCGVEGSTLQGKEDGEAPPVDAEDAVEGGCEHKGRHGHLACVEAAVTWRGVGSAGPLVRGPQFGGHHPLLGPLEIQHACTNPLICPVVMGEVRVPSLGLRRAIGFSDSARLGAGHKGPLTDITCSNAVCTQSRA